MAVKNVITQATTHLRMRKNGFLGYVDALTLVIAGFTAGALWHAGSTLAAGLVGLAAGYKASVCGHDLAIAKGAPA